MKCLLNRHSNFNEAEQVVLEGAAMTGKVVIFRYVLHRSLNPYLGENLRYFAVKLLTFNHQCINWTIGHHGDAVGLAVGKKDAELVAFWLLEGADVERSNYCQLPILVFAKRVQASQEMIDLLVSYGARIKENLLD